MPGAADPAAPLPEQSDVAPVRATETPAAATASASKATTGRPARSKEAGSGTDAPTAAANQAAIPMPDPAFSIPARPVLLAGGLPGGTAAAPLPRSSVGKADPRPEPASRAVGGSRRPGGSLAIPGLSAAAVDGTDRAAAGIAPAALTAPHPAGPTSSLARKSIPAPEAGAIGAVAAAPAAQPAPHLVGHAMISHLSPVVASAAVAADAATGTPIGSITADPATLQGGPSATAAPTSVPVREATPTLGNDPAPPVAAQVAPAMISLATRQDGSNEIRISLHPLDLGQVEIHLVRGDDGSTSVTVRADRPETLRELAQNAHHLHAALDAASVPTDGRTLDFVSATATTSDHSHDDASSQTSGQGQALGDGASGERRSGQDRAGLGDRQQASGSGGKDGSFISGATAPISSRRQWQFNGLNITA